MKNPIAPLIDLQTTADLACSDASREGELVWHFVGFDLKAREARFRLARAHLRDVQHADIALDLLHLLARRFPGEVASFEELADDPQLADLLAKHEAELANLLGKHDSEIEAAKRTE